MENLQKFKTEHQLRVDKLNALKSQLADLKHVKLTKRINEDKIANLEQQIEKLQNECTTGS